MSPGRFRKNRSLSVVSAIFALGLMPGALAAGEQPLGLIEAKRLAVESNPELAALRQSVEEAKAQRRRAIARYLPRVGVAGGVDAEVTTPNTFAGVGYVYGNINLFRGFEDNYRLRLSDLEVEKGEIRLGKAQFRVELDVEEQFYRYFLTELAMGLKKKALEVNEVHKKLASRRRASGLIAESDVMEFDLRDALLKSDLAALEVDRENAKITLRRLLGREESFTIEPAAQLRHWHLKGKLPDYRRRLKEENEAVLIASKETAGSELEAKIAGSRWFPEIDLETRAGYLPLDDRINATGAAIRGLVLAKFELFSGLDTVSQQKEAQARRLKVEAQLRNAVLSSEAALESTYRKLRATEARVHLEALNAERAKRYHDSVLKEYRRGVKNSADVRLAAESLFDAGLRRESFKYDFLAQRIELERILGGPVEVEPMPEKVTSIEEGHEFFQKPELQKKNGASEDAPKR